MVIELDGARFFALQEVADQVQVSRQTLWRWRHEGLVPRGRKHRGRQVLFSEQEVELIRRCVDQGDVTAVQPRQGIYLDNAATTRPLPEVRDAMLRALSDSYGNASSAHGRGSVARAVIEEARESVSALCGASPDQVHFTSGGTEANNWVLLQRSRDGERAWRRLITTPVEHSSILAAADRLEREGVLVERLPVRMDGQVDPAALADLEVDERTLVSVQWVNNETGVIQPVGDLAERTKARGGYFHCDAAQAVGKLLFEYQKQSFDYLTLTAHKIHGPQGVGALIRRSRAPLWSRSLGGTQESGLRGGTENTPGIAGFGAAAAIRFGSLRPAIAHCRTLRDYFEAEVRARLPGVQFLGNPLQRVGALTSLRLPGVDGQALVAQLDAQGVFVSQSSACTNMRPEPSYVLRAMGLTEDEAYESIRVAFSVESRVDEVMKAVQIISEIGLALGAPGVPTGGRSESGE